ncbi:MAG: VRR-NUC domain-containing protein, partial [Myxococcota bacterium]
PTALPSEQVAIARAARRVGKTVRIGIPPARPLVAPRVRQLRLVPAAPAGTRPRWTCPDGPRTIEDAVASVLRSLGRRAIPAESAPWSTLAAVLCAELWFLPVPGALPVRFLSGPVDLGTAAFRAARAPEIDRLLAAIDAGEAPARVAEADPRWRGIRLAGARWDAAAVDDLVALAAGLGPAGVRALIEVVVDHGPRATAGLPDLAVMPGPEVRIPDALPAKVPPGLILVEVKGPTDAVRDEQRVWHDRLVRAGAAVELWEVAVPPGSGQGTPVRR